VGFAVRWRDIVRRGVAAFELHVGTESLEVFGDDAGCIDFEGGVFGIVVPG
jgi:hypothetical protein